MSWSAKKEIQESNSAQNKEHHLDSDAQEEVKQHQEGSQSDSEYDEEEDEDYNPEAQPDGKNGQFGNEGVDQEEDALNNDKEYQKLEQQYKSIESGGTVGGLVKTRRARLLEEEAERKQKYDNMNENLVTTSNVSSVWENLKKKANVRLQSNTTVSALDEAFKSDKLTDYPQVAFKNKDTSADMTNKIKIKRTYVFAGQQHTEEKYVLQNSAEAKEYIHSLKFKFSTDSSNASELKRDKTHKGETTENQNEMINGLRRPMKRPPILEKIIAGSLKPKLSTLEKSKIDWAGFVDNEGIYDELQQNTKAGYIQRQEFLHRVDKHKDVQYKKLRQQELAEKFKT